MSLCLMTDTRKSPKARARPKKGKPASRARSAPNLQLRVSHEERRAMESAASRTFLTLTQWARQTLLREAGADPAALRRSP